MGEVDIKLKPAFIPKKNKSCFFVLPLLGKPMWRYVDFMNCYLGDVINKPEIIQQKIFIQLRDYDSKALDSVYFNQFYQLEDNTYMFVYDIPMQYKEDYDKFCEGKYSEMSEDAKLLICQCSGVKPIMESTVYKVLYKTADQKQKIEDLIGQKLPLSAEVYSVPNIDKEMYSYFSIKKKSRELEKEISGREKVL